jgi:phosphatidate cytidylyltransferase
MGDIRAGLPVARGAGGADVLWRKVATAVAMGAAATGLLVADVFVGADVCFLALVVAVSVRCLDEFYGMCETRRLTPFRAWGIGCAVALNAVHWLSLPGSLEWLGERLPSLELLGGPRLRPALQEILLATGVAAILGAMQLQAQKRDNDRAFESISTTLFGLLYVWFMPSFLFRIRHLSLSGELGGRGWNETGLALLIAVVAVSKLADVGGYLFGRRFGRRKMIPRISPNKTYEGLAAGLVLAVTSAMALWGWGMLPLAAWWHVLVFGLATGGTSALGDLAESLLKRGSGVKDAAALIPGFGGCLDVVDSVLVSGPVAYFLIAGLLRAG